MKPVMQEFVHQPEINQHGDCQRAVIASLLGLPIKDVPHFVQEAEGDTDKVWTGIQDFLRGHGYAYFTSDRQWTFFGEDRDIYHGIGGPSPRGEGLFHTVVGLNGKIVHDPHPSNAGLAGDPNEWQHQYLVRVDSTVRVSLPTMKSVLMEHRIAVTPENEGGWHAGVYRDSDTPVLKGYGSTPSEAVTAALPEGYTPHRAHLDDLAVDRGAVRMKAKLAAARAKGRGGWQTCTAAALQVMLQVHVRKGDPVDVMNLALFMSELGYSTSAVKKNLANPAECGILVGEPEVLGTRCMDGGVCHHNCDMVCFRKTTCSPMALSRLNYDWSVPDLGAAYVELTQAQLDHLTGLDFDDWYSLIFDANGGGESVTSVMQAAVIRENALRTELAQLKALLAKQDSQFVKSNLTVTNLLLAIEELKKAKNEPTV